MSTEINMVIKDDTLESLQKNVNDRKDSLARRKAELRHGARTGKEAAELSDASEADVSAEEAVEFAVLYLATED